MLRIFSLNGRLFPTLLPRTNPSRAAAQDELWSRLNVKADEACGRVSQLRCMSLKNLATFINQFRAA
jgi:hypothetical protein